MMVVKQTVDLTMNRAGKFVSAAAHIKTDLTPQSYGHKSLAA
jgi:hypothetical protein